MRESENGLGNMFGNIFSKAILKQCPGNGSFSRNFKILFLELKITMQVI